GGATSRCHARTHPAPGAGWVRAWRRPIGSLGPPQSLTTRAGAWRGTPGPFLLTGDLARLDARRVPLYDGLDAATRLHSSLQPARESPARCGIPRSSSSRAPNWRRSSWRAYAGALATHEQPTRSIASASLRPA